MAKSDPTISTQSTKPQEDEQGTRQVARPVEEADDSAVTKSYSDNPDKPAPSSVAQVEDGTDK
jgi:nitrogen fixation protein FixH